MKPIWPQGLVWASEEISACIDPPPLLVSPLLLNPVSRNISVGNLVSEGQSKEGTDTSVFCSVVTKSCCPSGSKPILCSSFYILLAVIALLSLESLTYFNCSWQQLSCFIFFLFLALSFHLHNNISVFFLCHLSLLLLVHLLFAVKPSCKTPGQPTQHPDTSTWLVDYWDTAKLQGNKGIYRFLSIFSLKKKICLKLQNIFQ